MALTSVVETCNNFLLALLAPPVHVAAGVNGWVHSERSGNTGLTKLGLVQLGKFDQQI